MTHECARLADPAAGAAKARAALQRAGTDEQEATP